MKERKENIFSLYDFCCNLNGGNLVLARLLSTTKIGKKIKLKKSENKIQSYPYHHAIRIIERIVFLLIKNKKDLIRNENIGNFIYKYLFLTKSAFYTFVFSLVVLFFLK